MESPTFYYGESRLTAGIALEICEGHRKGLLGDKAKRKITQSHNIVGQIVSKGDVVYGVTTGFGPLCTTLISIDKVRDLQEKLLKSHSVGIGDHISIKTSKLMLILKVHALALGYSGVSLSTVERIIWHIENNIIPWVPAQGSVGASGDLAPLSHLFLPLIGLGQIHYRNEILPTLELLENHNLSPLQLGPKEGLALINGTQFMSAFGIEVLARFQSCLDCADIIGAMLLDALTGSARPFHEGLHRLRPYPGSIYVASRLRVLLKDSAIMESHAGCLRVQDPYSLRCIPQVHGASRAAFLHLKEVIHTEINSVTDNPVLLNEGQVISGGNFHGQPVALPLDYAAIAAAELGNISDRRIYLSLEGKIEGVPKLLMADIGLNSGFMIAQYTTAALVSENKTLCFPASVDSIPTALGQEDHVSMGSISGRKALKVVENLEKILGVELMVAAQALDFRRPLTSGILIEACHELVRKTVAHRKEDEIFYEDMNKVIALLRSGQLIEYINNTANQQHLDFKNQHHEIFGIY